MIKKLLLCIFICTLSLNSVQSGQNDFLIHNVPSDSGMFAIFQSIVGALNYYEEKKCAGLYVNLTCGRYFDPEKGPNWWEYFFERIMIGKPEGANFHDLNSDETLSLATTGFPKDKFRVNELIKKYIHLKSDIKKELKEYTEAHFKGHYVIGVHHRGTDKATEWTIVPYEKTVGEIQKIINSLSKKDLKKYKIYVATDDQNFLDYIIKKYSSIVICSDFVRSTTATSLHGYEGHFYKGNYQKGKEALIDCLLLSKCSILIYPGTSCLSIISTCFNPHMPTVNLLETY